MWGLDRNEYVSAGTIPGSIFPAARFLPILPSCSISFIRILIGERWGRRMSAFEAEATRCI